MQKTKVNQKHKDRLFLRLFQEKQALLSLYNAVNRSNYSDPELLEITTLEDVLYIGIKNDVSFLIDNCMNLYEAQSSWNPNMPLRGLFYFSRLYSSYVESRHLDIYSRTQLSLPEPRYIVFYNGTDMKTEQTILSLSSSFQKRNHKGQAPCLECTATVVNINYGHNQELLNSCQALFEYSYLIQRIRDFLSRGMILEAAVDSAVEDCIQNGILADFLIRHREEAKFMILSEYNEELHLKTLYEDGLKQGKLEGKTEAQNNISALLRQLLLANRMDDVKKVAEDPAYLEQLLKEFHL